MQILYLIETQFKGKVDRKCILLKIKSSLKINIFVNPARFKNNGALFSATKKYTKISNFYYNENNFNETTIIVIYIVPLLPLPSCNVYCTSHTQNDDYC